MLLKYCICRYEISINEVSEELERMRAKVAELLEENNRLPEAERMDVHEFELDVEEQQRRGMHCRMSDKSSMFSSKNMIFL